MRRMRTWFGSAALLAIAVGAFLMAGTGIASAHKILPSVACVYHDTGTGQYNSEWSYNNDAGSNTFYAVGGSNYFSPSPQDRGQPTTFLPGQNNNVLTVTWNGSGGLTWTVDGNSATATTSSTKCSTNPVPIVGVQTILWVALAIAGTGGVVLYRRRRHGAIAQAA